MMSLGYWMPSRQSIEFSWTLGLGGGAYWKPWNVALLPVGLIVWRILWACWDLGRDFDESLLIVITMRSRDRGLSLEQLEMRYKGSHTKFVTTLIYRKRSTFLLCHWFTDWPYPFSFSIAYKGWRSWSVSVQLNEDSLSEREGKVNTRLFWVVVNTWKCCDPHIVKCIILLYHRIYEDTYGVRLTSSRWEYHGVWDSNRMESSQARLIVHHGESATYFRWTTKWGIYSLVSKRRLNL